MTISVIAHCDWSIDRSKRWMAVAIAAPQSGWVIGVPEPVGDTASLIDRLQRRAVGGDSFDATVGLWA